MVKKIVVIESFVFYGVIDLVESYIYYEFVVISHEKINQYLTDINRCLTNIFKI